MTKGRAAVDAERCHAGHFHHGRLLLWQGALSGNGGADFPGQLPLRELPARDRRAIGAQAVAWITVIESAYVLEQGTPKRYRTETEAWRTFCEDCGTSLIYTADRRPGEIDITTGSLDRPEEFPPSRDVFPEEKLSWVTGGSSPLL